MVCCDCCCGVRFGGPGEFGSAAERIAEFPERGRRRSPDGRDDLQREAFQDLQLLFERQRGGQGDGLEIVVVQRVVAEDLVDHLLRAAYQGRALGNGVLDVPERRVVAGDVAVGGEPFINRPVLADGFLSGVCDEHATGATSRAQVLVPWIVPVALVFFAVVVDQDLVVLAGLDGVGRKQRITPLGGERSGCQGCSRAVPNPGRASKGARRRRGWLGERRA